MKSIMKRIIVAVMTIGMVFASSEKIAFAKINVNDLSEKMLLSALVDEFDLDAKDAKLVYTNGGATAVKTETVLEDGSIEVTYLVPYSTNKSDEMMNSFDYLKEEKSGMSTMGFSMNKNCWNVVFSLTANYSTVSQPVSVGFYSFFIPNAFSVSYRLNGSGRVASITNLSASYDTVCNLYRYPECIQVQNPSVAFRDRNITGTVATGNPVAYQTYAAMTNMPSGYACRCENYFQNGGISVTFTYLTSSGQRYTTTDVTQIHSN